MVALQILILSVGVRIPIPLPMESYPSWAWHGLENRWTAKAVRVRFYYLSSILKRIEAQFDCYRNAAVSGR